jgi:hypothetical protein
MRDVVELGYNVMPVFGPCEAMCFVYLRTEVTEDQDRGLVGTVEDGSHD